MPIVYLLLRTFYSLLRFCMIKYYLHKMMDTSHPGPALYVHKGRPQSGGRGFGQADILRTGGVSSDIDVRTFWCKNRRIFRNLWCVCMDKGGETVDRADVLYERTLNCLFIRFYFPLLLFIFKFLIPNCWLSVTA